MAPTKRATEDSSDAATIVAAVFDAAERDDLDRAASLFAEDCVIDLPGERYEGRDGVRAWRASRAAGGGPQLDVGDPEAVDDTHALVPLTVQVEFGAAVSPVQVTSIWTAVDGLVTQVRAIVGGRRVALASLENAE